MNRILSAIFLALLFFPTSALTRDVKSSGGTPNNQALTSLYDADQAERAALMKLPARDQQTAGAKVWAQDAIRVKKTKGLLSRGEINSPEDYWHAAFIMQHGESIDDIRLAFSLGVIAATLAPDKAKYKWIAAAAWDRILTMKKQPQWYGTQYIRDPKTGKAIQAPVAEGVVTDAERTALGIVGPK
ncbi:MAG TPA: hypothetical protein PL007_06380 [Thermomonas sp.]|jgi:hypothetical protein|uniref:hypothetical protein n=1 Tax=Thermomonas sp. TaxID=1971895 RepID=UPI002C7729DF|nr:hypothetical protein [Thermomonas sp.]HQY49975.1 hypothetical protein [Thermomonas sp.]